MPVEPRTIDNLGIETSSRYAKDREIFDKRLIEESRFIPTKAEVSVLKPYAPASFSEYLSPAVLTLWASFEPPPELLMTGRAFFTHSLIPSLGGSEKQEADADKLEALEDTLNKGFKGGRDQEDSQEEERERQVLLTLMQMLGKLDRVLEMVNSRRNQYQRG